VCAAGPTVKGVDVSTYQGQVDWAAAKKDGVAFAFARVSDGLTHPDAQFTRNWQVLKTDGIIRGAYQFFRPALDPIAQADLLLQKLKDAGGLLPGDLPPVLDAETVDGVSNATLRANMLAWLTHVETATGRRPIVYTAQFMSANVGTGFASYPLWVANYGVTCPSMPDGWSAWKFWQSSSTGAVAGITGDVDVNAFNGTLADLVKLAGSASSPDAGTDAGNARDGGSVIADAGAAPLDAAGSGPPRGDSGATLGGGAPPATTGDAGRTASGDPCATSAAGR
jgi:lysozyme